MKKLIISMAFAFISVVAFSQHHESDGSSQLNVGLGMSEMGTPFYIGFDHSIMNDVTLGAEFSYRSYRESWQSNYYNHNIMGFSGNGNYHFNSLLGMSRRWDLYAGLNLGFFAWSSPDSYGGSNSSSLGLGGQFGGRCYLTHRLGLNLEYGGGNAFSGGKIGLTIKL